MIPEGRGCQNRLTTEIKARSVFVILILILFLFSFSSSRQSGVRSQTRFLPYLAKFELRRQNEKGLSFSAR